MFDDKYFDLELDIRFPKIIPLVGWQQFNDSKFIRPKKLFIYLIKCNDHLYVGSDPKGQRILDHYLSLRKNIHHNNYMQHAYNKYGPESFYYLPLIEIPEEYSQFRDQIENSYIKLFDTFQEENAQGFNLAQFAKTPHLGRKLSKDHVEKIRNANKGQKRSEEFCSDISKKLKGKYTGELSSCWGRKQTPEARARIAEAMRNRVVSEETKRKQSEAQKGRPQTERHILLVSKKYNLINPEGETIEIINMAKFARENNLNPDKMRQVSYGLLAEYKGWKSISIPNE